LIWKPKTSTWITKDDKGDPGLLSQYDWVKGLTFKRPFSGTQKGRVKCGEMVFGVKGKENFKRFQRFGGQLFLGTLGEIPKFLTFQEGNFWTSPF